MSITGSSEAVEETIKIAGADFDHENFEVSFEAVDPAENDRALLVGESLRRAGDISQRTFWEKYLKHVIADPDQEYVNLWEESILQYLLQSGALAQLVMSEGMQEQMAGQAQEGMANAEAGIQQRMDETISTEGRLAAQEMENISGQTGSLTVPREIMEQGMNSAARMPSRGFPANRRT